MHRIALFGVRRRGRAQRSRLRASACVRRGAAPTAGASRPAARTTATHRPMAEQIASALDDVSVRHVARLGSQPARRRPATRCRSRRRRRSGPGMVMFDERRRLRRRRDGRARRARPARVRPRHRAHPQLHRRRDRHPQLDLRLPRRRHPQHPRLRGRLPRRARRQARAELPLDADDPRRGQRGDRQQPRADEPSRCGPTWARATRSRSASSTTSTPRRGSSTGEIQRLVDEGDVARGDRGLLPDQRAVAGARGHARARARSPTR